MESNAITSVDATTDSFSSVSVTAPTAVKDSANTKFTITIYLGSVWPRTTKVQLYRQVSETLRHSFVMSRTRRESGSCAGRAIAARTCAASSVCVVISS